MAEFSHPTLVWGLRSGGSGEPLRMSRWNLASENYNRCATRQCRNHDASFLRFDTIPARDRRRDRRTDRQTDTLLSHRPAL